MSVSAERDHYTTLGVEPGATPDDIRKAYRRLARELHPDVSKAPDAEARFKAVNEAHEVLSDPQKRAEYDAHRAGRPDPGSFGMDEDDLLGHLFGELLRQRHYVPTYRVPLDGLLRGGSFKIRNGGRLTVRPGTRSGTVMKTDDGQPVQVVVDLPAGFRAVNEHIAVRLAVWPSELIGGGTRYFDHPDGLGKIEVKIEPGTPEGDTVVIEGRGMPVTGFRRGHLVVELAAKWPRDPDTKIRDAARDLTAALEAREKGKRK